MGGCCTGESIGTSFMYPRLISIKRPILVTGKGFTGYAGLLPAEETLIVSSIPASIQEKNVSGAPLTGVPSDAYGKTIWIIIFKSPNGTLHDRDIIVDDLGSRYQVTAAYWNSLGYQARCERLESQS